MDCRESDIRAGAYTIRDLIKGFLKEASHTHRQFAGWIHRGEVRPLTDISGRREVSIRGGEVTPSGQTRCHTRREIAEADEIRKGTVGGSSRTLQIAGPGGIERTARRHDL
jgi:hypothetical protein